MDQSSIGNRVLQKRMELGLTQEALAERCQLDTRTIQRIEKGEVKPYFSTLKTLSEALKCDLISELNTRPWTFSREEKKKYQRQFRKRQGVRLTIMVTALVLLLGVSTTFPTFRLFGIPKLKWAPYFYLIMFGLIVGIGLLWRCPACKASLGSPFNTRFCPRCGFKFKK